MTEWTFITKHAVALSLIARNLRITALKLGAEMGITERAVRKIIADLFNAGYIEKNKEGRGIRYSINHDLPLRHDSHREIAIGGLLESLMRKNTRNSRGKK